MSLTFGSPVDDVLDRLYATNDAQTESLYSYFTTRAAAGSLDRFDDETHRFLSDKFVALDRPKAEFCYHVCRALGARRVVEAGTSFGVSTIFLALAVRDNLRQQSRERSAQNAHESIVIGTEYEPEKARIARGHFAEAGVAEYIDLREGDLRQTLVDAEAPVDFMLVDIWTPMACPALSLIAPRLRQGAVVICDNTTQFRDAYSDYFAFIADPRNGLRTMTLPFDGGLEFTVRAD